MSAVTEQATQERPRTQNGTQQPNRVPLDSQPSDGKTSVLRESQDRVTKPTRVTSTCSEKGMTRAGENFSSWRGYVPVVAALAFTAVLLTASIFTGVADITQESGEQYLWITRVPRTIALVLAGASMSVAGLVMQLLTQNRFVEPTTVGSMEWAALGLLLTYIVLPNSGLATKMLVAILFSFAGTMLFFVFLRRVEVRSSLVVPIVGIMFGAVVSAVSTFIAIRYDLLQTLGTWFAGRFTGVEAGRYEFLWIVLFVGLAVVVLADRFTVAGLGKEIATNVGLNYEAIVLIGVGLVAVTTGVVTVVIGMLPFLGLIVPNLVSMVRGDNLRSNLFWVFLVGVWIVVAADLFGRVVIAPFEVPISVVLGALGSIVFVTMLVRTGRRRAN